MWNSNFCVYNFLLLRVYNNSKLQKEYDETVLLMINDYKSYLSCIYTIFIIFYLKYLLSANILIHNCLIKNIYLNH